MRCLWLDQAGDSFRINLSKTLIVSHTALDGLHTKDSRGQETLRFKSICTTLANQNYCMRNWPDSIPLPHMIKDPKGGPSKGLANMPRDIIEALRKAFEHPDHPPLHFVRSAGGKLINSEWDCL